MEKHAGRPRPAPARWRPAHTHETRTAAARLRAPRRQQQGPVGAGGPPPLASTATLAPARGGGGAGGAGGAPEGPGGQGGSVGGRRNRRRGALRQGALYLQPLPCRSMPPLAGLRGPAQLHNGKPCGVLVVPGATPT